MFVPSVVGEDLGLWLVKPDERHHHPDHSNDFQN
jgi:hypothetical protein